MTVSMCPTFIGLVNGVPAGHVTFDADCAYGNVNDYIIDIYRDLGIGRVRVPRYGLFMTVGEMARDWYGQDGSVVDAGLGKVTPADNESVPGQMRKEIVADGNEIEIRQMERHEDVLVAAIEASGVHELDERDMGNGVGGSVALVIDYCKEHGITL